MPRTKVEYRTASRDNYTRFCQAHPEVTLTYGEWCNVLYTFNYAFRDHMLETGDKVKMPWGMGDFTICKKKKKRYKTLPDGTQRVNLSINWKRTREEGKYIYHTNTHTEGYNFYWRWEHHSARFYQTEIWYFKPSRITSRLLGHYLNQEGYQHKYLEWQT